MVTPYVEISKSNMFLTICAKNAISEILVTVDKRKLVADMNVHSFIFNEKSERVAPPEIA